jgi:hypothetical protein
MSIMDDANMFRMTNGGMRRCAAAPALHMRRVSGYFTVASSGTKNLFAKSAHRR